MLSYVLNVLVFDGTLNIVATYSRIRSLDVAFPVNYFMNIYVVVVFLCACSISVCSFV